MSDNVNKMAGEENRCLRTDYFFFCPKSVLLFFYIHLVKKLTPAITGILEEEPIAELLCEFSLEVRGRE